MITSSMLPWVLLAFAVCVPTAATVGYLNGVEHERDRRDAEVMVAQVDTYARARLAALAGEREKAAREAKDRKTRSEVTRYVATQAASTECFTPTELLRYNAIGD